MAEEGSTDESQKTEEPTARRLEEARKKGQVVYSKEVSNWAILFAMTLVIALAGPSMMSDIAQKLQMFLSQAHNIPTDGIALARVVNDLLLNVAADIFMLVFALIITGILSGYIQTGPIFTFEPVKPDLSKISLIKGMERLFSRRSIIEFIKGIGKLIIISLAGIFALLPYFDGIEHFVGQDIAPALFDLRSLFIRLMVAVLSVLFIIAVLDYLYQRFEFIQKMRMSKQEMKEEFKQTEGDPMVKAKLRQIREAKARERMMQAVPTADVVITNPTHYAVALKYDVKKMNAPIMVAKGVDAVAENIKKVAKENKVPMVENAPLARALFDSMDLEEMIPAEHFKAVAEVISYVFRLKGKKI